MTERPFTTETTPGPPLGDSSLGHPIEEGSSDYESDSMVEPPPMGETLASVHAADTDVRSSAPPESVGDTKQVVADEAASVAADAKEGGRRVAETAASEAKDLASEATTQLSNSSASCSPSSRSRPPVRAHGAVSALRSLADELREMHREPSRRASPRTWRDRPPTSLAAWPTGSTDVSPATSWRTPVTSRGGAPGLSSRRPPSLASSAAG